MFSDWIEDTPESLAKALKHDMGFWKIRKIINSEAEQAAVTEIFSRHFKQLKDIFLGAVADSPCSPVMDFRPFMLLCKKANIMDKVIHQGILGTYFKATNFEEGDG